MPEETPGPISLLDRLKLKRAAVAQDKNRELRRLDRAIDLLSASKAESIIADAEKALTAE